MAPGNPRGLPLPSRFPAFITLACLAGPVIAAAPVTHGSCRAGDGGLFRGEGVTIKVSTKLQFTKALMREKIAVSGKRGTVTLAGHVSSTSQIALAGRIASEVDGVTCVNNLLTVGPPEIPLPGGGN